MTARPPVKKPRATALHAEPAASPDPGFLEGVEKQIAKLRAAPLYPGLYIVSTPIGNLADISLRALHTLSAADAIFCEDTRHSRKLLSAYGIKRKLEAYHDFSGEADRSKILGRLAAEQSIALISDAGTPLISDPGFKLVRDAIAAEISVYAVPGPSALLAAAVVSGLPSDTLLFHGFLPSKAKARTGELEKLRTVPGTFVFYESGSRAAGTLDAISAVFPERPVVVARELTKLHETVLRGSAAELSRSLRNDPPPGEFVILVGPGIAQPPEEKGIEAALRDALTRVSVKEAVEEVSKGLGIGRKTVYNLALKIRESGR